MRTLDEKGRCCGRKPIPYKRDRRLFCCRCCASFDIVTLEHRPNWAWSLVAEGYMEPTMQHGDLYGEG